MGDYLARREMGVSDDTVLDIQKSFMPGMVVMTNNQAGDLITNFDSIEWRVHLADSVVDHGDYVGTDLGGTY
jgi:hypothetical protein